MRPWLSLKMLLRSPFKTIITLLLIAAASFALFSRAADYAVTQRETNHAIDYYKGVAVLDNGVKNMVHDYYSIMPNRMRYARTGSSWPVPLTAEQINAFSSMPGVSSTDTRYMTAGVIDSLKRVRLYGEYFPKYMYADRFVLEGTYTGSNNDPDVNPDWDGFNWLNLKDCKLLAGNTPIRVREETPVAVLKMESVFMSTGGFSLPENPYIQSFVDSLKVGDRYLIIGRWSILNTAYGILIDGERQAFSGEKVIADNMLDPEEMIPPVLYMGDQDTLNYVNSFWILDDEPENYLETEKFAKVKEIIDITNRDQKTFDMVYTSDMLSIPRFNERRMVIHDGRALTKDDTNACVVSFALMKQNGLKIGDKLNVGLGGKLLMQNAEMGATAVIPERYGNIVDTAELEIVGAYLDTDVAYERVGLDWWSYSPNTIFVPKSLLPVEVPADYEVRPGEFSVVIDDARQLETFLDVAKPLAREMGISLKYSDRGWMRVKDSYSMSQTTSLITTSLFIGAAALALLLAAYMYILRGRKTYAIMRALGTPKNKARNTLVLPLTVLSALAIPAGGIAGLLYAQRAINTALEALAAVNENYVPDASLPVGAMLLCFVCEAAFLILLSALFMRKLGKTPPLALLQGDVVVRATHPGASRHGRL